MRGMWKRVLIVLGVLILLLVVTAGVLFFSLTETRTVSGVVRDADTHAPLAGVELSVGDARILTNSQGAYAIAFERGRFVIAATLDGYLPAQVQVNAEDPVLRVLTQDIELTANRVAGYVLDAETNRTIANAAVQMGDLLVRADGLGAFQARAVKTGAPISVAADGYRTVAMEYRGEANLNIVLAPAAMSVLVADLAGRLIPNAAVQAGSVSASTDVQGRAVLRRIAPGTVVRASAPGFESATATAGGQDADVKLALRPNVLDGIITDAVTGRPISNTLVYVGTAIFVTNANGAYHVDNVPAKATLTLKAPGYSKVTVDASGASRRDVKLQPFQVKGIHIPFAMPADQVFAAMDLVGKTELNALVLDVKAERGRVAWDSAVPLAKEVGAFYPKWMDMRQVIERCRADHIYCIARMPVFQDTLLATSRPDLALRFPNGTVYHDNNSSAWTNAANTTVWDYNIALAKEAAALGFDEIQFDYVRFPGRVDAMYTSAIATEDGRIAAINGFLARAQKELRATGVFISADVFGLTAATDDEQYTGQRLRELGAYVDYVAPMVYPDVWNDAAYLLSNGLGITNCTVAVRCPYDVIFNSYKKSASKTTAKVRLWLQAYPGKGSYGFKEYRVQKQAAEESGSVGWMFWNGAGTYDAKAFDARR